MAQCHKCLNLQGWARKCNGDCQAAFQTQGTSPTKTKDEETREEGGKGLVLMGRYTSHLLGGPPDVDLASPVITKVLVV